MNSPRGLFTVVLGVLVILRFIYILLPALLWWDASVYIGMGRYIASGGASGLWEYFRPPLLPLLFSIGGLLHINIIFWAKLLTFTLSIGSLVLIYRIGEYMQPYAGVYASFILGVSTFFFSFTSVPMTEVFGVFFSLLVLYLFIFRYNSFLVGLFVGLCFLLRFPYGILLPVFWIGIVVLQYPHENKFQKIFLHSIYYGLGFALVVVPYLVSNKILYGGYLLPFTVGNSMIGGYLWLYNQSIWYYAKILFIFNPLFLVALCIPFYVRESKLSVAQKAAVWIATFWAFAFFSYFTYQIHKEGRYIVPVFPALALLGGVGLLYLRRHIHTFVFCSVIIVGLIASISYTNIYIYKKDTVAGFHEFYSYLSKYSGSTVITSTPIVASYSPVKIIKAYNSWSDFSDSYMYNREHADFALINSCELYVCNPGSNGACNKAKNKILAYVSDNDTIIYDKTIDSCRLIITRINK